MTLAAHAATGALLSAFVPAHPVATFAIGFGSHFLLDMIPHWDYHLESISEDLDHPLETDMRIGFSFFRDLIRIGADFSLGFVLAILIGLFFPGTFLSVALLAAAGAVLPDALQFAYMKLPYWPLTLLQRFHFFVHARLRIDNWKRGVILQAGFLAVLAGFVMMVR